MANEYSFLDSALGFFGQQASNVVTVTAASVALNRAQHVGRIVAFNRAAGIAATLPAATGSGDRYHLVMLAAITSNTTTVKVADATDVMIGNALMAADGGNTVNMFEAGANDDTITFDGSTTGGLKGDSIELVDVALNTWWVRVVGAATGVEATPFSATVS